MSTYLHRIIEVRTKDGWKLVHWHNPLQEDAKEDAFTLKQLKIDPSTINDRKISVPRYNNDPEPEDRWTFPHWPVIINNGGYIRDHYLSNYSNIGWNNRGLPHDLDSETQKILDTYKYENDWVEVKEGEEKPVQDGAYDKTYVYLDEMINQCNQDNDSYKQALNNLIDRKVKLELKSLSVNNSEAITLLKSEEEDWKYDWDYQLDEISSQIDSLSNEIAIINAFVNNPDFLEIESNIRVIYFKTC